MKYIVCLLVLISLLVGWLFFPRPERTHVMLEVYATAPAFLQMTEFVKLPPKDKKIIGWHRFPKRGDVFPLSDVNAIELPLKPAEGFYSYQEKLSAIIADEIKQNPDRQFNIHSNMNQTRLFLIPLLKKLTVKERKQIKRLHLYEDGFCTLTAADRKFYSAHNYDDMDTRLLRATIDTGANFWLPQFKVGLHKIIPATYHLCHPDGMKTDPQFKGLTQWLADAEIVSSVTMDVAKTMTPEQKKQFYKLVEFDEPYWRSLKENNNLIVFTGGFLYNTDLKRHLTALSDFRAGKIVPLPTKHEKTIWLYKPHPSYGARGGHQLVFYVAPDIIRIPQQLPLETFVIADLVPDLVAGYDSSFFFNLPPENIAFIINKTHRYLNRLKELKIITNQKTIALGSIQPKIEADEVFMHHPEWDDTVIISDNRLIRSNKDSATVLHYDDKKLTVQWDNWGKETFIRDRKGVYKFSKE